MAEVYRADQDLTGGFARSVALKVIRPEYAESPEFREMFLDEARTACTLSHPNIVHIYEVGEAEGLLFMAMELVTGETVAMVNRLLRERGERFSDEALLAIGIHTCSALEAVHQLKLRGEGHVNLVHRDVSPHNLLLAPNGAMKLIDFGIAKAAHNRNLTSPGITKGKAGYFSPEQAMGRVLDGRSDLFSLGVTLYKLACGQTPFDEHRSHQARNTALVAGKWQNLREVCPGLPEGLYQVIDHSLALKPEGRWANAREMRESLEQVALESGVHVGPSSLAGYVEADDDELSMVSEVSQGATQTTGVRNGTGVRLGAGPTPRTGGFSALPASAKSPPSSPNAAVAAPSVRRHTERMQGTPNEPADKKTYLWMGATLGAAVLLGVMGVLLFGGAPMPSRPVNKPTVSTVTPKQEPIAVTLPDSEPIPKNEAPVPVVIIRDEPAKKASVQPKKKVVAQPVEEKAPIEDDYPPGEGTLRVQSSPPDALVVVAGYKKGTTPVNLPNVRSGKYIVEVVGKDKVRGSCSVKILPERTTRLIYNFSEKRCDTSGP